MLPQARATCGCARPPGPRTHPHPSPGAAHLTRVWLRGRLGPYADVRAFQDTTHTDILTDPRVVAVLVDIAEAHSSKASAAWTSLGKKHGWLAAWGRVWDRIFGRRGAGALRAGWAGACGGRCAARGGARGQRTVMAAARPRRQAYGAQERGQAWRLDIGCSPCTRLHVVEERCFQASASRGSWSGKGHSLGKQSVFASPVSLSPCAALTRIRRPACGWAPV